MLESQEEMGKIERFEEIEAWKEACSLAEIIYKITKLERFSKNYGLKEQIQRASVSIASNIAEGFERQTKKEFIYFLYIAKGSAGEVRTLLYLGRKLNYFDESQYNEVLQKCIYVSNLIGKFIQYLKKYSNT